MSGGNTESDPEMVLRRATTRAPIRVDDGDGAPTESPRRERRTNRLEHDVIDSGSAAEKLTVADGVDGAPVASFVSETDFETETLYLETATVEECFRLRLCSISWRSDEIRTDYTRRVRPYDERCAEDETAFESRLVRIPAAIEADAVTGYGSSVGGSGQCGGGPGGASGDGGGGE